jgi:abortive infection bacteriophage resistance protein
MSRPSKLTPEIQQKIGENIALGLSYSLAAEAAGVTYQSLNSWLKRGQTEKSGIYNQFFKHIQKYNADGARKLLERLNDAAAAGNCQVCMWILERRFSEEFGRRVYRKTNVMSENKDVNVVITITNTDAIRYKILDKLSMVGEL